MATRCKPLEGVKTLHGGPSVDQQLAFALFGHRQHQLFPLDIGRKIRHLNGHRADRPGIALAADCGGPVRRGDFSGQRLLGTSHNFGRISRLAQGAAGLEEHEGELRAGHFADGRNDCIPLPQRRQAGDAALDPAEGARVPDLVFAQAIWGSMSP
jgi:hypothetical protein